MTKNYQTPIAIGDVHGCLDALERLLKKINRNVGDDTPLWFVGDVLNRGPESLKTLERIIELGDRATLILGNHEMHLLEIAAGTRTIKEEDTIDQILNSSNANYFIDYLRKRPLCFYDKGFLMTHAGLLPVWDIKDALFLSTKISEILSGPNWKMFFQKEEKSLIKSQPTNQIQNNIHTKPKKIYSSLYLASSVLTRIRYCSPNGDPIWQFKNHPKQTNDFSCIPWFNMPGRRSKGQRLVFGHWSTLGLFNTDDTLCVDTGCSWGRKLTAVQLEEHAHQRTIWQVSS